MIYPEEFEKLKESFEILPGVGEKSAERYVYSVYDIDDDKIEEFAHNLKNFKKNIRVCSVCGHLTNMDVCSICSDTNRDKSTICVVEDSKSVFMFERLELLIGNKIESLHSKTVLIIGLGGVGGYAVETLIRSGIENITLVDFDNIDISNINRQVIALSSNIGNSKVEEFKKRILSINSNVKVKIIKEKINKSVEK